MVVVQPKLIVMGINTSLKKKLGLKLPDVIVDNYEYSLLGADWCKLI